MLIAIIVVGIILYLAIDNMSRKMQKNAQYQNELIKEGITRVLDRITELEDK